MKKIFYLFFVFTMLIGCHESSNPSKIMAFDKIEYVHSFPKSYTLSNEKLVDWDLIGMKQFRIVDSLLIVSTNDKNGFWSFFLADDLSFKGSFIKQGQGPNEFIYSPDIINSSFQREKDLLIAYIYDFQTGRLYKMNVDDSFSTQENILELTKDNLPPFLFDFAIIDDGIFYCKEIANEQTQQLRYILNHEVKETPIKFDRLNKAQVAKGEDFNIISSITVKHPKKDIIVEAPITLNQINLFSCMGELQKTICVGDKLDNIGSIENKIQWMRIYTYGAVRTYNDFFAVLRIGDDKKTFQTTRKSLPIIQLFNWEGEPIAEIKVNRFITSFDFDLRNKYLYTLDSPTDEFYRYNISSILNDIIPNLTKK